MAKRFFPLFHKIIESIYINTILVGRVHISQRPSIVEKKDRIGVFEIDLIKGAIHKQALSTINYRATGSQ